jgi:proliferating cell nuclear antigen
MSLLKVITEHTAPIKTLFEVLKDLLLEAPIEFRQYNNNKKKVKNTSDKGDFDSDSDEESDDNDSDDEDADNKTKKWSGMKIMAVDSSKTILIHLKLNAEEFRHFECKKEKMVIGVNFTHFHKLTKAMGKDDDLTLNMNEEDENYLGIKIENPEQQKVDNFKMKLMDLDNDPLDVPPTVFDAVITMPSGEFHKICREMNNIAEYVNIKCIKNKVIFSCKGEYAERETTYQQNKHGVNVQHASDNEDELQIVDGIYDLKSLVLFSKCQSLSNHIQIYMKNSYPLVIQYTVATLGKLLVCLTPIPVENDEEDDFSDYDELYDEDDLNVTYK